MKSASNLQVYTLVAGVLLTTAGIAGYDWRASLIAFGVTVSSAAFYGMTR